MVPIVGVDATFRLESLVAFNRYVDGLATTAPTDPDVYRARAVNVVKNGYSAVKGYE